MLFNSLDFGLFLPIVFLLYWFVFQKNLRLQNLLVLVASYVFYGWWDWRFLSLIAFSTLVDYFVGVNLEKEEKQSKRKMFLWISILVNLGFLGFFKYYNFFLDNFVAGFKLFGTEFSPQTLQIVLPVGISFYTFQTLSYSIDVYKRNLQPTRDIVAFGAFVSFFPQLVAGPIERASNLLPQFYKHRKFDYSKATDGMRQILWGLFKKVVIADNCAEYANMIFNNHEVYGGSSLVLGAIFFTFQIYGDFSGYSDIAIGTSRLFGFDLKRNFSFPYLSRDMAEFWRRWHISLSTWFRDYLYIPLGGSKGGRNMRIRNTFIIFLVSGFWHGANWTFIVWGFLNALYFLPLLLRNKNRSNIDVVAENTVFPSFKELFQIATTFLMAVLAWIFFRAENLAHAFSYLKGICDPSLFSLPDNTLKTSFFTILLIIFMYTVEWFGRKEEFGIANLVKIKSQVIRWACYIGIIFLIGMFMQTEETPFIYFQF